MINVRKHFSLPKLNMAIDRCAQKIPTGKYQSSGTRKPTAGGPLIRLRHNQSERSDQEKTSSNSVHSHHTSSPVPYRECCEIWVLLVFVESSLSMDASRSSVRELCFFKDPERIANLVMRIAEFS